MLLTAGIFINFERNNHHNVLTWRALVKVKGSFKGIQGAGNVTAFL